MVCIPCFEITTERNEKTGVAGELSLSARAFVCEFLIRTKTKYIEAR